MSKKIILSADGTCDIGAELAEKYNVKFFDFHIQIGDQSFIDKKEISTEELFAAWRERGLLPKTAAIAPGEYLEYFKQWTDEGYEIIHFNLGSTLSAAHQNCSLAAAELEGIYPIDSAALSSGTGLLVAKAGEMIAAGMEAAAIRDAIMEMRGRTQVSFVLDTLEFMRAGGRCSATAAFGANLLKLKVGLEVDNQDGGRINVGKKYRGVMEKVLQEYVADKLKDRDDLDTDLIFITHACSPESDIELVRREIACYADFKQVKVTQASGTIAAHCGPRTLGILFMTKEK